jgi:hypothetical protein
MEMVLDYFGYSVAALRYSGCIYQVLHEDSWINTSTVIVKFS